ncbi:MAG: PIN domain-containing protein [Bergeyella sp.]
MKIVVDTNVVFSSLVNTNSAIAELIIGSSKFHFYSSEYLYLELGNHHEKLKKASKLTDEQLNIAKYRIFKHIECLSLEIIPKKYWIEAEKLVSDIDPDDVAFVALALYLDAYLWTGDIVLYNGLKSEGFDNVINTSEVKELQVM